MSRLVRVPRQATDDLAIAGREDMRPHRLGAKAQPAPDADNYLERIAKYVPGEVLAFFVFINVILEQAVKTGGKAAAMAGVPVSTVALCALLVGLVLTPLFVWYVREEGDAWVTNACRPWRFRSGPMRSARSPSTTFGTAIWRQSCSRPSRW